uniref:Uncharacterized protein n=1 Tax=Rhizophagus irregularis (strain DAOM 181602 / DAOM 197198 / MUCL 43194) TaxID=747089 RepID=U9TT54_RHIID
MEPTVEVKDEEVMTWVNDNKKKYIKAFFEYFHDIYDEYLVKIVECKKIEEYTEVERKLMGPDPLSKPGKIPTRLNKPTTKVLAVYYFISLFLIKRAGQGLNLLLEGIIYRARVAALNYEQIKKENAEILDNFEKLEKRVGDSDLTSGLLIADLENRIRNLEADVIAKERIILEKNEANNILWEKIKVLEEKEELPTKKTPKQKRKRARANHIRNGTINEIDLGTIGDNNDKDYLDKYYAERSRDITFYDIPAYWTDKEIFDLLNDNVGHVEYMWTKRCHKYKTVKTMLRFSKEYEKIYKEGGVNVSLPRKNRTYFIRMFDSCLQYAEIKHKFRWQAVKRITDSETQYDDVNIIKDFVKTYRGFFGKIIRVKGIRFLILYFNKEKELLNAITESMKVYNIGQEFLLKKENDCIDENGDIQELNRRPPWRRRLNDFIDDNRYIREYSRGTNNWNRASRPSRQEYNRGTNNRYRDSRTYDSRMEWEQQRDEYTHSALLRMNKQWR